MPEPPGSAMPSISDAHHANNHSSVDQVRDAVTAACAASISGFLTKFEAKIKGEIQQEMSELTNEALEQYIIALRVFLSHQTPQTGSSNQDQQQRSQILAEMLDLHVSFQRWCARQAAERKEEEAKLRVEALYSSGPLKNLSSRYQRVHYRYWNSLGMFIGLGGASATPLLPTYIPENPWGFWV